MTWAVDLNADGGALLIALLTGHGQRLLYIPGRTVHHASRGYRGDGKTDAKDAYVIADQARMRRDLQPLQEWDEIAVDLKILTGRRYDLAADRTRAINRMRAQLLEYFPALERTFDYAYSRTRPPSSRRSVGTHPRPTPMDSPAASTGTGRGMTTTCLSADAERTPVGVVPESLP